MLPSASDLDLCVSLFLLDSFTMISTTTDTIIETTNKVNIMLNTMAATLLLSVLVSRVILVPLLDSVDIWLVESDSLSFVVAIFCVVMMSCRWADVAPSTSGMVVVSGHIGNVGPIDYRHSIVIVTIHTLLRMYTIRAVISILYKIARATCMHKCYIVSHTSESTIAVAVLIVLQYRLSVKLSL